jgi:hypothetical protein
MPQSVFGIGNLFAVPSGANPTPSHIGALQDVSVDFSFDMKQLYGGNQFALEQARGKGKIDIKASTGRFDPVLFNTVVFGLTTATGETLNAIDEGPSAIPGTPFQVTVANAANWVTDLGVYDVTAKLYKTRVASSPAAGQYSVAAGVYAFAAADTTHNVKISYTYSSASTGTKLAYTNQLLGASVVFGLELVNSFTGADGVKRSMLLHFPAVQCPKLSMPLKLDDFSLPQLEMHAQDDGSGNVFDYSFTG